MRNSKFRDRGGSDAPGGGFLSLGAAPLPQSGVHRWSIKLIRGDAYFLGVAEAAVDRNKVLGADESGWGYMRMDKARSGTANGGSTRAFGPRLKPGDAVMFELDAGEGTLGVLHNGEPQGVAFRNLKGKTVHVALGSTCAGTELQFDGEGESWFDRISAASTTSSTSGATARGLRRCRRRSRRSSRWRTWAR